MLEFIYTSAPETLDGPGYGAVAKSDRFPADLEKYVRKLCRYDYLSNGFDPDVAPYPVVVSHSIFRQGAEQWHVFSQIVFAGHDYTHRSVFLAHHVIFTADELSRFRVSDLLRQSDLFRTSWTEPARILPSRSVAPRSTGRVGAKNWNQATGDSRWGQVWAKKWLTLRNEPRFLIVPDEFEPLQLFLESLDTLTSEQAAQTTFVTHLATDKGATTYEWIGITANTELAKTIERHSKDHVLNLTRSLGSPADSLAMIERAVPARMPRPAIPKASPVAVEEYPLADDDIPDEYPVHSSASQSHSKSRRRPEDALPDVPEWQPTPTNNLPTYLTVGAIFAVMFVGMIVWMNRPVAETHEIAGTPEESEKSSPVAKVPLVVAEQPKKSETPTAVAQLPTQPSEQQAPLPPPRAVPVRIVKFVSSGLWESVHKSKDQWCKLTDFDVPDNPQLRLVASPELKLISQPDAQGPLPSLRVTCSDIKPETDLHLQIRERRVWLKVPSAKDDTNSDGIKQLFDRLRFSILEIESSLAELKPDLLELAFTPQLPAVSTCGLGWVDEVSFKPSELLKSDLNDLFMGLNRLPAGAAGNMNCFLRINRVTLAIQSNQGSGWPATVPTQALNYKTPLNTRVQLANTTPAISGTLKLETHFDREGSSTKPAIAAELLFTESTNAEPQAAIETPAPNKNLLTEIPNELNAAKNALVDLATGGGETKPDQPDASAKAKTKPDKKEPAAKKPPKKTTKPGEVESPADLAKSLPEHVLLQDLFRRYGRVHIEVVVLVPIVKSLDPAQPPQTNPNQPVDEDLLNKIQSDPAKKPPVEPPKSLKLQNVIGGGQSQTASNGLKELVILRFGE